MQKRTLAAGVCGREVRKRFKGRKPLLSTLKYLAIAGLVVAAVCGVSTLGKGSKWSITPEKEAEVCPTESRKVVIKSKAEVEDAKIEISGIEARATPIVLNANINGKRMRIELGKPFTLNVGGEEKKAVFISVGPGHFKDRDLTMCIY